jgi:hypothetical protein
MAEESQEIKKGFSSFLERFSADNAEKRKADKKSLDGQKQELVKLKTTIESQGGVAEKNAEYNKADLAVKLKDLALQKRSATNKGAQEEIEKERQAAVAKQGTFLQKIAGGIGGILGNMKDKALAAGKGLMSILKGSLFAGFLLVVANWLQSPSFAATVDFITNTIMPMFGKLYDGFVSFAELFGLGPGQMLGILGGIGAGGYIAVKIVKGFKALSVAMTAFRVFMMNNMITPLKNVILGAGAKIIKVMKMLPPAMRAFNLFMMDSVITPLKNAVMGVGAKLMKVMKMIGPAISALRVFMLTSFLPAIAGMAASFAAMIVPFLPVILIVAAIAAVGYALYEGFKVFQQRFEETGSIVESISAGIGAFIGTILGLIPTAIQKAIVWIAELFGFKDFAKWLDSFDIIGEISGGIEGAINGIVDFFKNLFDFDFSKLLGDLLGKAGVIGKKIANFFGFGDKSADEELSEIYEKQATARAKGLSKTDLMQLKAREMELKGIKTDEIIAEASPNSNSKLKTGIYSKEFAQKREEEGIREEQELYEQARKNVIMGKREQSGGAPTIINNANVKTANNTSNSTTSSTSYIGNPDQTIAMSAGSY